MLYISQFNPTLCIINKIKSLMYFMKNRFIYIGLILLLLQGCASKKELILFNDLEQNRTHSDKELVEIVQLNSVLPIYHIKKYDRVAVSIYGAEPELVSPQDTLLVDYRGNITLPLIGSVRVAGLTEPDASSKIQKMYRKKYYKDLVFSLEVAKKEMYVIGEVEKPGPITLPNQRATLLQAIAKAGSFKDTANREAIYLIRKRGNHAEVTRYSLSGNLAVNNAFDVVLPNDIIYVAPNGVKVNSLRFGAPLKLIGAGLSPIKTTKTIAE